MTLWLWIGFLIFVLVMLALDLGFFNRKAHVIETREALRWTSLCVALAMVFTVFVHFAYTHNWLGIGRADGLTVDGKRPWLVFLTGYIVEMSLSLDNIFVIAVIFNYFAIPREHQHRVLFWGILGALVMRGIMIGAGTTLIDKFDWMIYVFGVLLLLTAVKMMFAGEEKVEPEKNLLVRIARKFYPVATTGHGQRFFVEHEGKRAMTPVFVCLLIIESTDVLFAVDSIPAIIAITQDPYIVFTSNVFAILCLRSMYFALSGMMHKFKYLKTSLVFLLAYIAVKMLLSHHYHIDTFVSLAVIVGILSVGVVASILGEKRAAPAEQGGDAGPSI